MAKLGNCLRLNVSWINLGIKMWHQSKAPMSSLHSYWNFRLLTKLANSPLLFHFAWRSNKNISWVGFPLHRKQNHGQCLPTNVNNYYLIPICDSSTLSCIFNVDVIFVENINHVRWWSNAMWVLGPSCHHMWNPWTLPWFFNIWSSSLFVVAPMVIEVRQEIWSFSFTLNLLTFL
mgnify:CR=1 FL=1